LLNGHDIPFFRFEELFEAFAAVRFALGIIRVLLVEHGKTNVFFHGAAANLSKRNQQLIVGVSLIELFAEGVGVDGKTIADRQKLQLFGDRSRWQSEHGKSQKSQR